MRSPGSHRTALITGITGQDGIYLTRLLQDEGCTVVGTASSPAIRGPAGRRVTAYLPRVAVVSCDVRDRTGMRRLLEAHRPDEVYNLAALSSVALSWAEPALTLDVNATAVAGLLDDVLALRDRTGADIRFFQASSAEVHGSASESPYAQAKALAEVSVVEYRERHDLHACFATLHNHESPLRDGRFLTRKVTRAAARIAAGRPDPLTLGNLAVRRDWGHARDYVVAMRAMLRTDAPIDLPIGTGVAHSVTELVDVAFDAAGVEEPWAHVQHDESLMRPRDAALIVADPEPARQAIGWTATTSFVELVAQMVHVDQERLRRGVEDDPAYLLR
ncbi:GDP-mannose 4,6-dehydratase [Nocardioides terrisoli]|uniref:GDP-mannose 4,6-dehydratase n=1 Tax=Nocardioides terrisoli TaxID=3388267 RepID=UPI00287B9522|nr:GDP-mannose 4,6-dehydratase [Nocardioides marmorisolisilvae]